MARTNVGAKRWFRLGVVSTLLFRVAAYNSDWKPTRQDNARALPVVFFLRNAHSRNVCQALRRAQTILISPGEEPIDLNDPHLSPEG
jgi:hypothetical protein